MKNTFVPRQARLLALLISLVAGQMAAAQDTGDVVAVVPDEVKAMVADQQGKIVVVNFWATWCPPCIKEFPDFIKLHAEYESRGVSVIAISMNEEEELEDIAEFLEKYNPPFPVYRAATQDEDFYIGISEQWRGEMPLTLVFDSKGGLLRFYNKPVTFEMLEEDVKGLLSSS